MHAPSSVGCSDLVYLSLLLTPPPHPVRSQAGSGSLNTPRGALSYIHVLHAGMPSHQRAAKESADGTALGAARDDVAAAAPAFRVERRIEIE